MLTLKLIGKIDTENLEKVKAEVTRLLDLVTSLEYFEQLDNAIQVKMLESTDISTYRILFPAQQGEAEGLEPWYIDYAYDNYADFHDAVPEDEAPTPPLAEAIHNLSWELHEHKSRIRSELERKVALLKDTGLTFWPEDQGEQPAE